VASAPEVADASVARDAPPAEELRAAAAQGVRWSSIARPTIEVVQLVSIVVLARLIAPEEFGRFAIALIVQEVAYLIVAGGLTVALVQRKALDREHEEAGMALALLLGVVLAGLTLAAASLVVAPIFGARTALLVRLMAPLCLIAAMSTVPMSSLRRRLSFRRLSEIEVLGTLVRVVACIGLALLGLSGVGLVLGLVLGALTVLLVAWISAPPPAPRLHRAAARELLDFALPGSLAAVSWVGFSNVDYAIIAARLGPLQTGYYFRSYTLAVEYQSKIGVVMNQVGFPVLARSRDASELDQLYRQMVRLLTVAVFPLLVLLAIGAPVLVPFLFGERWEPSVLPVQILALGGASTLLIDAAGTVLMANGRARALLGYGIAHFATYGLTVLAVVHLGIVAVAVDAAVVHTLFLVGAYALMLSDSNERSIRRLWDDVAPAAVSCLGLVAVALPVSALLTAAHAPDIVWLVGLGAVAAPAYLITLRVCFPSTWRAQRRALARVVGGERWMPGAARRRLATIDAQPSA
jgi:O-antigen/teichoic acid export membrane protein